MIDTEDRITITPRYPSFAWFMTPEANFKVLEYKDHIEVYRSDRRGRWRRRKTMPKELTAAYKSYRSYDLMKSEPRPDYPPPKVLCRWDLGPVHDPAFMERQPNPIVAIRTEDGQVLYEP